MVQGLNFNNYSAQQIVELKTQGTQIPEEVLNKACQELNLDPETLNEITATSNDAQSTGYVVKNDAGDVNEAKELREQLESEGTKLKEMVKQFTDASNQAADVLANSLTEIEAYQTTIAQNDEMAKQLGSQAEDAQQIIINIAVNTEKEVAEKNDELDFLNEKIENGDATEADIAKAEDTAEDISKTSADGNDKIQGKMQDANGLNSDLSEVNAKRQRIANSLTKAVKNATDGKELAAETKDLSQKLYDKGMKTKKIAMALGTVAGGVGGFFAGKAVGNKLEEKANTKYAAENGLESCGTKTTITNDKVKTEVTSYRDENGKYYSAKDVSVLSNGDTYNTAAKIGGAALGAGLGLALGSLFGKGNIEKGTAGLQAAENLSNIAKQTNTEAIQMAVQNDITIETTNAAEVSISGLLNNIKDANTSVKEAGATEVAEAPEVVEEAPKTAAAPEAITTEVQDNEDLKKKPVV